MTILTVFDIVVDEIERLNQFDLTSLMNKILRTELSKANLRQAGLKLSLNVLAGDDALDATIEDPVPSGHQWLPEGISGWQFKAEDITPKRLKEDVITKEGELSPLIEDLLNRKGTYVLVVGSKSYGGKLVKRRVDALSEVFAEHGFPDTKILVYSSGELVEWVNQLPRVLAHLSPHRMTFKDINQWHDNYPHIRNPPYVKDTKRNAIESEIRETIYAGLESPLTSIIRIVGLAGIGKTRLIYESLAVDEDLANQVIFIENPDKMPHSLFNELSNDEGLMTIVVIDECPNSRFIQLAEEVEGIGGRITFIALDFDIDSRRTLTDNHFIIDSLAEESIEELAVTLAPGLPDEVIKIVIEHSEGYPRFAVLLTEAYTYAPEIFTPADIQKIGIEGVYEKLIQGRKQNIEPIRTLLRGISLFKRIGWDGAISNQGQYLCSYLDLNWGDARALIHREIERGIIVKRGDYIYITPRPLADFLASTWWDMMDHTSIKKFHDEMPDGLMTQAFIEKISEIPDSKNAQEFQERFFLNYDYNTLNDSFGSRLFVELTKSNPKYALNTLERLLLPLSTDELLKFEVGRTNIVWAIQMILWWPEHYSRAIYLLLKLSLAENQTYSNNATNSFKDSFKPVLSGTSVPLTERIEVLKNIAAVKNIENKKLVIDAINTAFSSVTGTHRSTISEDQGISKLPKEWYPSSSLELVTSLKQMLELIDDLLDKNPELVEKILSFYTSKSRIMIKYGMAEELIIQLNNFKNKYPMESYKKIISTIEDIMAYEKNVPDHITNELIKIQRELVDDSFESRINRYVKIKIFQDRVRENKDDIKRELDDLAEYSITNPYSFINILDELVRPSSENSYDFGFTLGQHDKSDSMYEHILDATIRNEQSSVSLLGGYLSAEKNPDNQLWFRTLDIFELNKKLHSSIIDLFWLSKGSDRKTTELMRLLSNKVILQKDIIKLLYGGWFLNTSRQKMNEFMIYYYDLFEGCINPNMVDIIYQYYRNVGHSDDLLDVGLLYIKNENILNTNIKSVQHAWYEICIYILKNKPVYFDKILTLLIKAIPKPILDFQYRYATSVLEKCVEIDAKKTWSELSETLNVTNKQVFNYMNIIRGDSFDFGRNEKSLLDLIPHNYITNWVEEDPNNNAVFLARIIPLKSKLPEIHPLAKYVLTNYGHLKYVESELSGNWFTEGFSGHASEHYIGKKGILENWMKNAKGNVAKWISKELDEVNRRIEYEKKKEEEFDLF